MEDLKIEKAIKARKSVTRTIRISGENFDKISELAEKHDLSFNAVVNQIIDYGLRHLAKNNFLHWGQS